VSKAFVAPEVVAYVIHGCWVTVLSAKFTVPALSAEAIVIDQIAIKSPDVRVVSPVIPVPV